MVSSFALLSLVASAMALSVTSPTSDTVWTTGDSETITWDSVSSDQSSFNIYLSNFASYPTQTILLASDVETSDGSIEIDGSKLVSGNSFTINFTNGTATAQIYAQSPQFNITEGSSSSSSTTTTVTTATGTDATASTTSPATGTADSTTATGSSTATGSAASGSTASSTSTSSSTSASASSGAEKLVARWTLALGAVAAFVAL